MWRTASDSTNFSFVIISPTSTFGLERCSNQPVPKPPGMPTPAPMIDMTISVSSGTVIVMGDSCA